MRTEKIVQAAKNDRVVQPMPKEQVGTLTQRIVGKKGATNFAKAMRFVQKPWWKVDPHYFNQREFRELEDASREQGLTIHRMVTKQRDRVKSKIGTTVGGKLKKYSLTSNTGDCEAIAFLRATRKRPPL